MAVQLLLCVFQRSQLKGELDALWRGPNLRLQLLSPLHSARARTHKYTNEYKKKIKHIKLHNKQWIHDRIYFPSNTISVYYIQYSGNMFQSSMVIGRVAAWHSQNQLYTNLTEDQRDNIKGKAIPLQVWTSPEGSKRLRFTDFNTIGAWRWQGCQPYAPAAFTPGNIPGIHFC